MVGSIPDPFTLPLITGATGYRPLLLVRIGMASPLVAPGNSWLQWWGMEAMEGVYTLRQTMVAAGH